MSHSGMRTVQRLFVVSVALFVGGIGFIVAGARTARLTRTPGVEAPATAPVATIKQIMNGIVMPNATVIYSAVGSTISGSGIEEFAPKNDKEWTAIADSAAAIVESGNLLLLGDRVVDNGDWITLTRTFIDQGKIALKAAVEKNKDDIFMAGGDLNGTCDACHEKYQRQ